MGQLADILEFHSRRIATKTADWEATFPRHPARLVVGSDSGPERSEENEIRQDSELRRGPTRFSRVRQKLQPLWLPEPLMMVHPPLLGTAMVDLILIGGALSLASRSLRTPAWSTLATLSYLLLFLVFAAQAGLYRDTNPTLADQQPMITKALLWTTLVAALARGTPANLLLPLALAGSMNFCGLILFRYFWTSVCGRNSLRGWRNVAVVGNPIFQREITSAIELEPHSGRSVKAFLSERDLKSPRGPAMLLRIARQQCVDEVILATHDASIAENVLQAARRNHLDVSLVHTLLSAEPIMTERVGWITLLKIYHQPFPEWRLAAKRLVDVVLASALLVLAFPVLLLIALGIKLDSRGPVFYRAERIGYRGHRFTCNKFRTMRADADGEKDGLRARNERQRAFFKIQKDPRITGFGTFLRRYSLDELPQLWNVVRGEMSLVGPRPHPPDDVRGYGIDDLRRLDCVPGITGLWQVTARQDPSFERCVALDLEYIKHWSVLLDLRILFKTLKTVLQGGGA